MTDTDALMERLAEKLHYGQGYDDWGVANDDERGEALDLANEVLPIVAEEVRKAKAEVWVEAIRYSIDCGNETTDSWGNMYRLDWIDRMEREIEQNPYAPEIGDSNEHR